MSKRMDVLEKKHTFIYRLQDAECDTSSDHPYSDQDSSTGYSGQGQKQKKAYRTRSRAKASDPLPEKIPIISRGEWINAISFQKNKFAYMYQKDDSKKLPEIQTLRYLYGVFMLKNPIDIETEDLNQMPKGWLDCTLTIYIPDYLKSIGVKENRGNESVNAVINKISGYSELTGVVREEEFGSVTYKEYPVIKDFVYDDKDNTVTFSSPYIMMIIRKVESTRIRRDKKGNPIKYKTGKLALLPVYSYRLNPQILHERNVRAAEVTGIIATLIDRAGSPNKKSQNKGCDPDDDNKRKAANISFWEIINRSEKLKREYENHSKTSNKNKMLESVFGATWKFLLKYTDISSSYKNIKLPDPKDKDYKNYIPTSKKMNEVLRFPHDGRIKGK